MIQNARRSVHLQLYQVRYYEEQAGTPSNLLLEDLAAAARRGVDVNLLIDTGGWNPSGKNEGNLDYADRLAQAGVKVWEDSPEEVSHQKVMTVDDDITVIGSPNWTFYSFAHNNEVAAVVRSRPLNEWFKRYFCLRAAGGRPRANAETVPAAGCGPLDGPPTTAAASAKTKLRKRELPAADVEPLANRSFYPRLHDALLQADESIDVVQRTMALSTGIPSPGALPGQPAGAVDVLAEDLISAARRGLKVRVVLDRTKSMDEPANAEAAAYLKQGGVEVFQDDPEIQTHAKLVVIDGETVVLGTTNWTAPAVERGNEASVLITSREAAVVYKRYVRDLLKKGSRYEAQPDSIWRNASEGP